MYEAIVLLLSKYDIVHGLKEAGESLVLASCIVSGYLITFF